MTTGPLLHRQEHDTEKSHARNAHAARDSAACAARAQRRRVSTAERARIASAIAGRFACYGSGTVATRNNPIAVTLREQPPTFAFGVPVRDVVDAVCDELGGPVEGGQ